MHDLLRAPKSSGCSRCNSCLQNAHSLDSSSVAVDLKFWPVAMLMLYSLGQLSLVKIEASSGSVMDEY